MTRVISFKVPRVALKPATQPITSDRSSTWAIVKQLGPCEENSRSPPTPHEEAVLSLLGKLPDSLLDVGDKQLPLPFTYHSAVNGEANYITQPRLLVTKLLTSSWCELRKFYEIYAGLPRKPPTARIQSGTDYHNHLEAQDHAIVPEEKLKRLITEQLEKFSSEEQNILNQNSKAADLGSHWADQVVTRSLVVSRKRYAREIYVHGFLNIHTGKLATTEAELPLAVLVNGQIDVVKIDDSNCKKAYTDSLAQRQAAVSTYKEATDEELFQQGIQNFKFVDLSTELPKAKERLDQAAEHSYLHVRDVKTRASNFIPQQQLVVNAAKVQCMFYAQFLHNLSQSAEFGYASKLENAKRRGVDVDKPLGVALATLCIILNWSSMMMDMRKLARGARLGFEAFDQVESTKTERETPIVTTEVSEDATEDSVNELEPFSLSNFLSEAEFRSMLAEIYGDSSPALSEDISDLFKPWKRPLTLRYFAARSGQAFHLFEKFKPGSVCIEYHNVKTHRVIAYKHFPFSDEVMSKSIEDTCSFWSGQRKPRATDDRSKCRHCDFLSRCPAINAPLDQLAGEKIYKLLGV